MGEVASGKVRADEFRAFKVRIEELGAGKVVVGLGGDAFGDVFVARPGQTVTVTNAGSAYRAKFSDVVLIQMPSKAVSSKTVSGDFGCKP